MLGCLLVALLLRLMLSRFCVTFTLLTDVAESFAGLRLGVLQYRNIYGVALEAVYTRRVALYLVAR